MADIPKPNSSFYLILLALVGAEVGFLLDGSTTEQPALAAAPAPVVASPGCYMNHTAARTQFDAVSTSSLGERSQIGEEVTLDCRLNLPDRTAAGVRFRMARLTDND